MDVLSHGPFSIVSGSLGLVFIPFLIYWSVLSSSTFGSRTRVSKEYYWEVQLMCQPFFEFYKTYMMVSVNMYSLLFGCGIIFSSWLEFGSYPWLFGR